MTYTPSESEKQSAAAVQALAAFFIFIPPAVALRTRAGRSPYVRYWAKTCLGWSLIMTILILSGSVVSVMLNLAGPAVALIVVHVVFCITGALSSYFNTPFRYWFVANKFCSEELGNVYGQLLSTSDVPRDASD